MYQIEIYYNSINNDFSWSNPKICQYEKIHYVILCLIDKIVNSIYCKVLKNLDLTVTLNKYDNTQDKM